MKISIFSIVTIFLALTSRFVYAQEVGCTAVANFDVRGYIVYNEGQQYAVDVLRVVHYVDCSLSHMSEALSPTFLAAKQAYDVASVYSIDSTPTYKAFRNLTASLDRLEVRFSQMAQTEANRDSRARVRVQILRLRALVGS